jgi:hypothetical protein
MDEKNNFFSTHTILNGNVSPFMPDQKRYSAYTRTVHKMDFSNHSDFNSISDCIIPNHGDLLGRLTLVINLPEVQLQRTNQDPFNISTYNKLVTDRSKVTTFMSHNLGGYRLIENEYKVANITLSTMKTNVTSYFNAITNYATDETNYQGVLNDYVISSTDIYTSTKYNSNYECTPGESTIIGNLFTATNIKSIATNPLITTKAHLLQQARYMYNMSRLVVKYFYDKYITQTSAKQTAESNIAKFAWVDNVGNVAISEIKFYIGDKLITTYDTNYIYIHAQLHNNHHTKYLYDYMIGNTHNLITYNNTKKNSRLLYIPLPTWFQNNPSNYLPLFLLKNTNIRLQIKFNAYEKCCYSNTDVNWTVNMHSYIYVEYMHITQDEKNRFKNADIKYIIEQVNIHKYNNIMNSNFIQKLDFKSFIKDIYWVLVKKSQTQNTNKQTKTNMLDYTCNTGVHPITKHKIIINDTLLVPDNLTTNYYNSLIPIIKYNKSISDGINIYTFAIYPTIIQPSGLCNFDYANNCNIHFNTTLHNDDVILYIYTVHYNILRFVNGEAIAKMI